MIVSCHCVPFIMVVLYFHDSNTLSVTFPTINILHVVNKLSSVMIVGFTGPFYVGMEYFHDCRTVILSNTVLIALFNPVPVSCNFKPTEYMFYDCNTLFHETHSSVIL